MITNWQICTGTWLAADGEPMILEIRMPLEWKDDWVWSECLLQGRHFRSLALSYLCGPSFLTCNLLWLFEVQVELVHLRKTFLSRGWQTGTHWFGWNLIFSHLVTWMIRGVSDFPVWTHWHGCWSTSLAQLEFKPGSECSYCISFSIGNVCVLGLCLF